MLDWWRRWTWQRYESRVSTSDDFATFQRLFSGPLTPDLASKMPLGILLKKRDDAGQETRGIIDAEINRRLNSRLAIIANLISVLALIVSVVALARSSR
jgi:hypothetical protein